MINSPGMRAKNWIRRQMLSGMVKVRRRSDLVKLGSRYGGWIVPSSVLGPGSVCYCAGLGEDGSFDQELAVKYRCAVYTFDPTPRAIAYAEKELSHIPGLRFSPLGLWPESATLKFYVPADPSHVSCSIVNLQSTSEWFDGEVSSVSEIMRTLDHERIDLLKLDIEGAEYEVLDSLLRDKLDISVICVEFDQPTALFRILRQIHKMQGAYYDVVAIDHWNVTLVRKDPCNVGSAFEKPRRKSRDAPVWSAGGEGTGQRST